MFPKQEAWDTWLEAHHAASAGIWLRLARNASAAQLMSYSEALEVALCYGWIDAQRKSESENAWLQKFTPRASRSMWSKINRQKALALIRSGRMKPAGLQEVERAQKDGRWDRAYDSPSTATVPSDFQAALDLNARAKAFFTALDRRNRYAILFRIQTVKKRETRAKRIEQFITMLERNQKLHP